MRQVASTFIDGRLRYFVADSETGELDEIAVIKPGPAFDGSPTAMVTLGFGLIHETGYNGKAARAAKPKALPPAPVVTEREPAPRGRRHFTFPEVVEYVRAHPGSRSADIAEGLGIVTTGTTGPRQRVENMLNSHVKAMRERGQAFPLRPEVVVSSGGRVTMRRWFAA